MVFRCTSSIAVKEHYVVWYGAILLLAADVDFGNCNIMFTSNRMRQKYEQSSCEFFLKSSTKIACITLQDTDT